MRIVPRSGIIAGQEMFARVRDLEDDVVVGAVELVAGNQPPSRVGLRAEGPGVGHVRRIGFQRQNHVVQVVGANLLEFEQELAVVQFGDGDSRRVNQPAGIGLAIHLNLKGIEQAHVGFKALNHQRRAGQARMARGIDSTARKMPAIDDLDAHIIHRQAVMIEVKIVLNEGRQQIPAAGRNCSRKRYWCRC